MIGYYDVCFVFVKQSQKLLLFKQRRIDSTIDDGGYFKKNLELHKLMA